MLFDKLKDVLSNLLAVYEKVLVISKQKNIFLTANDVANLEKLLKQEDEIVKQAIKLEATRKAIVQDLAKEYDVPWKGLTMTKLLEILPEQTAQSLREQSVILKNKVFELSKVNESNALLIKNAITFINFNINVLAQVSAEPTYAEVSGDGRNIKAAGGNKSRLFDAKC